MAAAPKHVPDELADAAKKLALKTLSVLYSFEISSSLGQRTWTDKNLYRSRPLLLTSLQAESKLRKDYSNDE